MIWTNSATPENEGHTRDGRGLTRGELGSRRRRSLVERDLAGGGPTLSLFRRVLPI
jgi:hypothetical protein